MGVIKQSQMVVWVQEDGRFTAFEPHAGMAGRMGLTGKNVPQPSINTNYEIDRDGTPRILNQTQQPATGGPTNTIQQYEGETLKFLERVFQTQQEINVQERIVECGLLDNPHGWDKMRYWAGGKLTGFSPGDGPTLGANTDNVQLTGTVEYERLLILIRNSLASLTSGTAEDITAIAGLAEAEGGSCSTSYPGADQILYAGLADGDLLFSRVGGGAWASVTNAPFAVPVVDVAVQPYDRDQGRVIVTDATVIKTANFDYGDEGGMTWTIPTLPVVATAITALGWGKGTWASRVYFADDGDIYVSTDRGITFEADALYTGVNAINAFAFHPDGTVAYAAGAANTILRESNQTGGFSAVVGPSGGGAFTALAVATDGTLFAGNGTNLYMSNNRAANTGGWSLLYNFGANKAVVAIQLIKGFSQAIRVVVDDTTGAANGQVWESLDGGASWRQLTEVANTGYNGGYFSELDDNLGVIVGDDGTIHRMAP